MPQKSLGDAALERMHQVCQGVAQNMGLQLLELNGEADHVHLLVEYPPPISVLTLVNHLKGVSSRMLRKEFPELAARGSHLWTLSYLAASAGGALIERLREYGRPRKSRPKGRGMYPRTATDHANRRIGSPDQPGVGL